MLQKSKNRFCGFNKTYCLSWLVSVIILSVCYGFASRPVPANRDLVSESEPAQAAANSIDVGPVYELIYQGRFGAAGQLANSYLDGSRASLDPNTAAAKKLGQLLQIVQEYEAINQRRAEAQETAYQKQLTKLEKLQATTSAGDVNDVNDVIDINDVNDIIKVFSAVRMVSEFANQSQKEELLSDSFVKQVFQKAIDKASELESKGKWLDAYLNCYHWLVRIDEDNQGYSDYTDQLMEKANIVASFQDSPCETRKERFQKVKEKTFIRSIDFLKSHYVSTIDYRQMALKAINRCELLAEVMNLSFSEISKTEALSSLDKSSEGVFFPPDSKKLAAWSAGLAVILDEVNNSPTGMDKKEFKSVFEKLLLLNTVTAELPRPVLIAQFAEAALSALDAYTVMIWPRQVEEFEKIMTNKFTGIGIRMIKEKGLIKVASLLPDTPAYRSGLDAGDLIEAVDGVTTKGMSATCAVKRITGPAGTIVRLRIRRPGNGKIEDKVWDIPITRDVIVVPTINGWQRTDAGKWLYIIDRENQIGYVRISSFTNRTSSDLEKVLLALESRGLNGLILDLRTNTGGLLPIAIKVTDKFIKEGLIVSTRPPNVADWTWAGAREWKTHPNYPLVVLINSDSASASEILAGALADPQHNRAVLVGERTHGKGSVQGITPYPGGGAQLKYTMAYYHLPSGQRVESRDVMKKQGRNDWGIKPDVEVKLRRDEYTKTSNVQWDNLVLARSDHDNSGAVPLEKHTIEETLESDPQLAVGLLVIKSKLIQADVLAASAN